MQRAICGVILGCLVSVSTACDAGGFFRRVPEVGEWATYRRTAETTFFSTTAGTIESASEGAITLKCVGEVERDGERHLWIEVRWNNGDTDGSNGWAVIKLLIPESKVVEGDFAEHAVAAWAASSNFEAYEVPVDWESLREDECVSTLLIAFPWTSETMRRREQKTLVINDRVELTLEFAETGRLDAREIKDGTTRGSVTWWPSMGDAFGVAAADITWRIEGENYNLTTLFQLELVETGTDAVSDLPDHN